MTKSKSAKPVSKNSLDRKDAARRTVSVASAKKLEREIEQAAARGDRKLVQQLTTKAILSNAKADRVAFTADTKARRLALADTGTEAMPKASKSSGLEARIESFISGVRKAHTETYAKSLYRPLADFLVWCEMKSITDVKGLNTHALQLYCSHVQAQGYALSTSRMALARVQTFCRVASVDADLSVLRLPHTIEEKEHMAELAAERSNEEAV
jgi:hypothetical protein